MRNKSIDTTKRVEDLPCWRSGVEAYYKHPPGESLWWAYNAMKCASLRRETMWSMVSELHSEIDFDYGVYTAENLKHFEQTFENTRSEFNLS